MNGRQPERVVLCLQRPDSYGLLSLQESILSIMVYLDAFCREHGIVYFLMGGSALGALRHQGFIPWDDDLDVFMDLENFKKFERCCEMFLDQDRFYYQKGNTEAWPHYFAKLRLENTTYLEAINQGRNVHQGIFVDIFCLIPAAPAGWRRKVQYYQAGLLKARAITKTAYHTKSPVKKLELAVSRIAVNGPVQKYLVHQVFQYDIKSSGCFAHLFGRAGYEQSFYPASLFEKARYVPFETLSLPVPWGADAYCAIRYGADYMEMPDEATRARYASHPLFWDTRRGYEDYVTAGAKGRG